MAVIKFRSPHDNRINNEPYDDDDQSIYPDYERDDYDGQSAGYDDAYDGGDYYEEEPAGKKGSGYEKKIRAHRFLIFLRTFLLIALIVGGATAFFIWLETRTFTEAEYVKAADLARSESAVYENLDGHLLVYTRDGASLMDAEGKTLWNITYEMQRPLLAMSGNVAAIADYNGSTVYIVSTKEYMGAISTNMPIRGIAVSESGEVAAVLSDSDITWVYLFDLKGNPLAYVKTTMEQTGYPIGICVSPSGELVCISHLRPGSDSVRSSVAFYNFGVVGQNVVDNYVSGYDFDGEVMPVVRFLTGDTVFGVSDSRIAFFTGKEIPQNTANTMFDENLLGVYYGDGYAALLFPDMTGEERYRLDVYTSKGEKKSSIRFAMDFTQIQIASDQIIINNGQECAVYNTAGEKKYEGNFGREVSAVIPTSKQGKFLVITGGIVEKMTLK